MYNKPWNGMLYYQFQFQNRTDKNHSSHADVSSNHHCLCLFTSHRRVNWVAGVTCGCFRWQVLHTSQLWIVQSACDPTWRLNDLLAHTSFKYTKPSSSVVLYCSRTALHINPRCTNLIPYGPEGDTWMRRCKVSH